MRYLHTVTARAAIVALAVAAVVCAGIRLSGQQAPASGADKPWTPPRTADGQPDIQGMWNSNDSFFTPLQRPLKLAGKSQVSDEELKSILAEENEAKVEAADNQGGTGAGPLHWYEFPKDTPKAASLLVEPADGRLPALTPWAKEQSAYNRTHQNDGYWTMDPGDRCISRGILGMMMPTFYNNGKLIVQTPTHVVVVSEMIHDARFIPIDGRAHVSEKIRQWQGDPRGHWEGNTLVVETTNFKSNPIIRGAAIQTQKLKLTERFTPTAPNVLMYSVRVEDDNVFTQPWTIEFPFRRDNQYQMFEYACHEGNHAVAGVLSGARAFERAGRRFSE